MKGSLLEQYKKQWSWRDWDSLYALLPDIKGKTVYDLGCAHGDHSQKLSEMGARVIGLDGDHTLLDYAKGRGIENASFQECNLSKIDSMGLSQADGVWISFVAAYFTDFQKQLQKISQILKPGGWIAITEMSGLFNHKPLEERFEKRIQEFYQHMSSHGHYDFTSGEKIKKELIDGHFEIKEETFLEDHELAKKGACDDDVVAAWENRLARMQGFQNFLGADYSDFEKDFLRSLSREEHISNCQVFFFLALKKQS